METLEDLLLLEMSRRNTDMVANMVLASQKLFDPLMSIYLKGDDPANRRAAWVTDIVTETRPEWILPYIDKLAAMTPQFGHDALRRHALRILSRSPLPGEEVLGVLIDHCFRLITSPSPVIAPKIFSMDLLYRISQQEPDLKQELADSIEWRMQEESPGFKNKGARLLKQLYKEINPNNP